MAYLHVGSSWIKLMTRPTSRYIRLTYGNQTFYGMLQSEKPPYMTLCVATPAGAVSYLTVPNVYCGSDVMSIYGIFDGSDHSGGRWIDTGVRYMKIRIPNVSGTIRLGINMDNAQLVGVSDYLRTGSTCHYSGRFQRYDPHPPQQDCCDCGSR